MAKKQSSRRPNKASSTPAERPAVTGERFTRLYRLLRHLGEEPRSREQLLAHLGLDVRGFYRDLELLRSIGIVIQLDAGNYLLGEGMEQAIVRLPFPDLHLTLGEMQQLARGKTRLHRLVQEKIEELIT